LQIRVRAKTRENGEESKTVERRKNRRVSFTHYFNEIGIGNPTSLPSGHRGTGMEFSIPSEIDWVCQECRATSWALSDGPAMPRPFHRVNSVNARVDSRCLSLSVFSIGRVMQGGIGVSLSSRASIMTTGEIWIHQDHVTGQ
jgi:hypothetical protein